MPGPWVCIACFVGGLIVGSLLRETLTYLATIIGRGHPMHRLRTIPWLRVLVVIVLIMNFLTGALLVKTRLDAQHSADCLARYNQAFATAYAARNAASIKASGLMDDIVRAVDARDRDALRKAVDAYVQQRDAVKAQQKATPYPPFPSTFCGKDQP